MDTTRANQQGTGAAAAAPALAPAVEYQISVLDLVLVLLERWRLVVGITAVIVTMATVIAFVIPKTYRSTAKILPLQQTQPGQSMLMDQVASMAGLGSNLPFKTPSDLYVALLQVDPVLDQLVKKHELMRVYGESTLSGARKRLADRTEISATKEGMITITVEDRDPKRAAALGNGYADELAVLSNRLAITDASRRRLFLERQIKKTQEELIKAETAMTDTQKKTGMIQLDVQAKSIIDSVAALRAKIVNAEVTLAGMQSYTTERNPDRVRLEQELSAMRRQLSAMEHSSGGASSDVTSAGDVPDAGLEYLRRTRDVKGEETIFALLVRQYELAKIDEARDSALVQVVQPAVEPETKSGPKRMLIILMATVVGLLIACVFAFLRERREQIWNLGELDAARIAAIKRTLLSRGR